MPEVAAATDEKLRSRIRGGWMFDLVLTAAARYYEVEREAFGVTEDIGEDAELRIAGLSKVVAKNPEDADGIAALAREELSRRIRGGYIGRMTRNVWRDFLRRQTRELRREADPEKADKVIHANWSRHGAAARPVHSAERDERMRLTFGTGATSPAHELVAYAWCPPRAAGVTSGESRTPQAFVEDFASFSIDEAGRAYIDSFAEATGRDAREVVRLFGGLLTGGQGRRRMWERWDTAAAIEEWVEEVRSEGGAGKPLHMRVAWLYRDKLGYSPARIVAELGMRRLDSLAADFAPLYAALEGRSRDEVAREFGDLLETGKNSDQPLNYRFKPHRKVNHWQFNVSRRTRAAEMKQLKHALRVVGGRAVESWKILAFLACHCLGRTPHSIVRDFGRRPLRALKDSVAGGLAEIWDTAPEQVHAALVPLSRALNRVGVPGTLEACFGSEDAVAQIQAASRETLDGVARNFVGMPELRLFAIRHRIHTPLSIERGDVERGAAA